MLVRYDQVEKQRVKIHRPQANRHFEEAYLRRLGVRLMLRLLPSITALL